jgi:RNA polymerase sigma factor (sigma-70 family)
MAAESKAEPFGAEERLASFERLLMPHLGAAYNLARWLTRDDQNAEDLVQDTYLRALKAFDGFRDGDARSWLLRIVRNTFYTGLERNRTNEWTTTFDEEIHSTPSQASNPEALLVQSVDDELLKDALQDLPPQFREVMVMRELEGLSYREIATISGVPVGTVMSRLARARKRLQVSLTDAVNGTVLSKS